MKPCDTLAALAVILSPANAALTVHKRQDGPPRVVNLDLHRTVQTSSPLERDRLRRRQTVEAELDNLQTLYFVNCTIGTPPQELRFHLDTGSSDLWVNTDESALCSNSAEPCSFGGTYNANSSSTYSYVGSHFNISYVDGSGASGDYVRDDFALDGTSVSSLQFGIGYSSSAAQGILGIGYVGNEVQVVRSGMEPYNNLPAQMVADGLIGSNAYSLWLNDLDASTGTILFGGVDTERYEGELGTLPLQENRGGIREFLITLTSLSLGGSALAENEALAVLLDSGSSLTYLPDTWVSEIFDAVEAQYDATEGAAFVPCSVGENEDMAAVFSFSGVEISVSMAELVIELVSADGSRPRFNNGVTACLFGIAPAGSGTNVLGDTFLRSAYIVFDLENDEVSLAQSVMNATGSNVLEIGTGDDAVPGAKKVKNPVTASAGLSPGDFSGGAVDSGADGTAGRRSSTAAAVVAVAAALAVLGMQ